MQNWLNAYLHRWWYLDDLCWRPWWPSEWLNEAFYDCLALAGVQLAAETEVTQDSEDIVSANEPVGEDEGEEEDQ